jgi:polar amino acid transport system substrate-binding protein
VLESKSNQKLYSLKSRAGRLLESFTIGLLFITTGPIRYYEFRTAVARFLSAVLAIGSTFIIASITAILASAFTLDQLRSEIKAPGDLASVRVGALGASTAALYLQERGIAHREFSNLKSMIAALDGAQLDAVVSDAAFLRYEIKQGQENGQFEVLSVLPYEFEKQNYAIALPEDSPYIEKINQALLSVRRTLEWKREVKRYLGD